MSKVVTVNEMRERLISLVNYADEDELVALYEKNFGIKVVNKGDEWFSCYVEEPTT